MGLTCALNRGLNSWALGFRVDFFTCLPFRRTSFSIQKYSYLTSPVGFNVFPAASILLPHPRSYYSLLHRLLLLLPVLRLGEGGGGGGLDPLRGHVGPQPLLVGPRGRGGGGGHGGAAWLTGVTSGGGGRALGGSAGSPHRRRPVVTAALLPQRGGFIWGKVLGLVPRVPGGHAHHLVEHGLSVGAGLQLDMGEREREEESMYWVQIWGRVGADNGRPHKLC